MFADMMVPFDRHVGTDAICASAVTRSSQQVTKKRAAHSRKRDKNVTNANSQPQIREKAVPEVNRDAPVAMKLLGGIDIRAGGRRIVFPTRHAVLMFAFLAVEKNTPQTRNKLTGLFWGDRGEQQARGSLRQTLYRIRRSLEWVDREAVVANSRSVSLRPELVWTDVEALEADDRAALGEVGGSFLDGWEGMSEGLDEWIFGHRQRIRERLHGLLNHEIQAAERRGDHAHMAGLARRLVALDRFDEAAARSLMTGLALAGNMAAAGEAFVNLKNTLEEIHARPSLETETLAQQIGAQSGRFASPGAPSSVAEQTRLPAGVLERRQVTVLAVWISQNREFHSEDPERVLESIDSIRRPFAEIVERYGGTMDRVPGMANVCWFGWPDAHEDAAERAVRAAIALRALSRCRIGIATGEVIVGVGRDPVGAAPDDAMQLMAASSIGEIRLSRGTADLVSGLFDLQGVEGSMPAYRFLDEPAAESRFAARHRDMVSPMIGRSSEFDLLLDRIDMARQGEGRLVVVTGEAGIGKSRLAEEGARAARDMNARCILLQCSPFARNTAFGPVAEHLRLAADLPVAADAAMRRQRLDEHLRAAGVTDETWTGAVRMLLGLDSGADAAYRRGALLDALSAYFLGEGIGNFNFIVLEDAHWADPSTLELVHQIAADFERRKTILVITARPGFDTSRFPDTSLAGLSLAGLTRADVARLVRQTAEGEPIADRLVERIVERADGVPLFAEELTRSARRSPREGWISGASAPEALRDALTARLDGLGELKSIAQRAACVGRRFAMAPLRAACGELVDQIDGALLAMLNEKLIFRHAYSNGDMFIFRHALVRDAAYDSLPRTERRAVHQRLFEHFSNQLEVPPQIVAHHAASAEMHGDALRLYVACGNQALAQFAHREARGHFENALAQIEHVPFTAEAEEMRLEIMCQLSLCCAHAEGYGHPNTLSILSEAQRLALSQPRSRHTIPILWQTFSFRYTQADAPETRKVGEQILALEHWRPEYGPQGAVGWRFIAAGDMLAGKFAEAEREFARAGTILETAEGPSSVGAIGVDQSIPIGLLRARVLACMGREREARGLVDDVLLAMRERSNTQSRILGCLLAAQAMLVLRDFAAAGSLAAEGVELSDRQDASMWLAYSTCIRSIARMHAGEGDEPAAAFRAARHDLFESLTRASTTLLDALFAEALVMRGQAGEAAEMFGQAMQTVGQGIEPWCHAEVMRLDAEYGTRTGRYEIAEAAELCRRALDIARAQGAGRWISSAQFTLSRLLGKGKAG
jgi:DNA-binding SARP family transcriptional activator